MRGLAIAMAIGALTACSGSSSPTTPTPMQNANIDGPYNVTITASSTCSANLPREARSLLFVGTITQAGASVQVQLVSHQNATGAVSGTVSGQTVTFPSFSLNETLGQGATIGLIFGIPLLIAGLVLPVFMMRDLFQHNEVNGPCPYCSAPIKTSDATIRLNCPSCKRLIEVRETTLQPGE